MKARQFSGTAKCWIASGRVCGLLMAVKQPPSSSEPVSRVPCSPGIVDAKTGKYCQWITYSEESASGGGEFGQRNTLYHFPIAFLRFSRLKYSPPPC